MICPKCNSSQTRVIDSRDSQNGREIRRRRVCENCENRFTTFERCARPKILVEKKDGFLEPYDREKVESGIWRSLKKRNINPESIKFDLDSLEDKWGRNNAEVSSNTIGDDIMNMLLKHDEVAYIRYASIYKDFKSIQEFENYIKQFCNPS